MTTYNENKVVSFEAIFPSEADTFQYSIATMEDGTECVVIEYLDTFPTLTVQVPESISADCQQHSRRHCRRIHDHHASQDD